MRLIPVKQPLESVSVDLLCPLLKTKAGNRFILVIDDRFMKLTKVVSLKHTTGIHVAETFA